LIDEKTEFFITQSLDFTYRLGGVFAFASVGAVEIGYTWINQSEMSVFFRRLRVIK
jgi:hypothetical protein